MLATYGNASYSQNLQSEHSYSSQHPCQSTQIAQDGYPRVLRSTSENIRNPNQLDNIPSGYSKSLRPSRPASQVVKTIKLWERLNLLDEADLFYEAIAIKKVESKRGRASSRSNPKDGKETKQLYKKIPAAASAQDCKQDGAYYKYRSSAKQERCKKIWCKEHDPHVMWPDDVERSFQFWIRTILPMGKKKVTAEVFKYDKEEDADINCKPPAVCRKQCGRNELISMMIYLDTGHVRDRKRISSHIQVLRGHTKRDNDEIFLKDDSTPAPHDECAKMYEEWGKLRWNPETKRIEPDRKPQNSDLRSSYQVTGRTSRYDSSQLAQGYSTMPDDGPPRFKEMHFCLYVTLKHETNDHPLHTYTVAQQRACAKSKSIHDIPKMQAFFPPTRQISDDPHSDQLFYCEASLRMRHDLTEKGYQVGPEMQVMLSCPPDYHNWRVRASGYRDEGTELVKAEERLCQWAPSSDGQVQIVLWASAVYWAQLLSDCKLAFEGKRRPGSETLSQSVATLMSADPSTRCDQVLEEASFVQEIFATRSDGAEVRAALLLWRFRQAMDSESTGLWTWRKIERHLEAHHPGSNVGLSFPRLPTNQSMAQMRFEEGDDYEEETFDFNDLSMPIPGPRVSVSDVMSPRSPSFEWNAFAGGARQFGDETALFEQQHVSEQAQTNTELLDAQMKLDTTTEPSSLSSNPSSAYPEDSNSSDMAASNQESGFAYVFGSNMDLPSEWDNLDFSTIPGLETPVRQVERHNVSSQQLNSRIALAASPELGVDNPSIPIDPALSAWGTPAFRAPVMEPSSEVTPTGRSKSTVARALTYLPPVSQDHILKSSKEDTRSSPGNCTTPTQQRFHSQLHGETSGGELEGHQQVNRFSPSTPPTSAVPMPEYHSPLEPYRPAISPAPHSASQITEANEIASPSNESLTTHSFHSVHEDETTLNLKGYDTSFMTQQADDDSALESFHDHDQSQPSFDSQTQPEPQAIPADQHTTSSISQATGAESIEIDWQDIAQCSSHPSHLQDTRPSPSSTIPQHLPTHTGPQYSLRHTPHTHTSTIPPSDDLEELCGDAAQLAQLSSLEVCNDGCSLAKLAQLHAASIQDSFSAYSQASSFFSGSSSAISFSQFQPQQLLQHHASQQSQSSYPSQLHPHGPTLRSQRSRSGYPSLSGLEALISAAIGGGDVDSPANSDSTSNAPQPQMLRAGINSHRQGYVLSRVHELNPASAARLSSHHLQFHGASGNESSITRAQPSTNAAGQWDMRRIGVSVAYGSGVHEGGHYGDADDSGHGGVGAVLGEVGDDFEELC